MYMYIRSSKERYFILLPYHTLLKLCALNLCLIFDIRTYADYEINTKTFISQWQSGHHGEMLITSIDAFCLDRSVHDIKWTVMNIDLFVQLKHPFVLSLQLQLFVKKHFIFPFHIQNYLPLSMLRISKHFLLLIY